MEAWGMMGSTRVVTTCLLALVLASSCLSIVRTLRPAPEDGVNGKVDFNLTQTGASAFQEILWQHGSSMTSKRTSLIEASMGIFGYLFIPNAHAIADTYHKEQAINLQREKQGGSNIGHGRHLNEVTFQDFSISRRSEDSTSRDISSVGPHHPAWDLRPIIWDTLGVYIILVAVATCVIKRRRKDDSSGGATATHRQHIWKETASEHWAHIQAHAEFRVVPHRPTYVNAPAAGQITRVWAAARAGTAVLQNQPLFRLAVDGEHPRVISTPAPGCVREVVVVTGMRVAKDAWLAALDTQPSSDVGPEPVDDPFDFAHPVLHPGAYPPQPAHPVVHPGASSSQPDHPIVHPAHPAHPVIHPGAHSPQPAHRVVHPRAWSQHPQPNLPVGDHAQPAQRAQRAGPSSARYAVELERSKSI